LEGLRFADNLDGEAVVALGLTTGRLLLAGLGAAAAWGLAETPSPAPVRIGAAAMVALATSGLAWGRVRGVSVARWSWLLVCFAGRLLASSRDENDRWFDAEPGSEKSPIGHLGSPGRGLVAFVGSRPGVGCSSVRRAVAHELESVTSPELPGGTAGSACQDLRRPAPLLLCDWGTEAARCPPGAHLAAVVIVWDGIELYPCQLAGQVDALRGRFPDAEVLIAANRAGPATGLSARIAAAGARLVAAIPVEDRLGDRTHPGLGRSEHPSGEGIRTLARAVLAISRLE